MKSLGKNAFLNGFRNLLNLLFPLLTFPYISKTLNVDGIGKYNFAQTTVNYFMLIAGLGISSYAIREGSKYRNEKEKFNNFASEILFCNMISTLVAYILLIISMLYIEKLSNYTELIVIFSFQILFTTIGVEWIYSIFEEYAYITKRSIIFKIISILFIFIFVKKPDDVNIYAGITVFASVGSNLLNLINSKRYFNLVKIDIKKCLKHIKPVFIIFASNIAISIYVYSDTTILGFMTSDYEVGIYSVSVKIYNIVKSLLSSILIVTIPRLSMLYGEKDKNEFKKTAQKVFDSLITIVFPAVIGLYCVSSNVVLFISDKSYLNAVEPLKILCVALLLCIFGWFFSQCILMPANGEKIILIATCISAIVNIALNFIIIPFWKISACAFTTLVAEFIMLVISAWCSYKIVHIKVLSKNTISVMIGCAFIYLSVKFIKYCNIGSSNIQLISAMIMAGFVYGIVLIAFRNPTVIGISDKIKDFIKNI